MGSRALSSSGFKWNTSGVGRRIAALGNAEGAKQKGPEMKEQMKAARLHQARLWGRAAVLFVLARDPKLVARYNNSSSINAQLAHCTGLAGRKALRSTASEQVSNGTAPQH